MTESLSDPTKDAVGVGQVLLGDSEGNNAKLADSLSSMAKQIESNNEDLAVKLNPQLKKGIWNKISDVICGTWIRTSSDALKGVEAYSKTEAERIRAKSNALVDAAEAEKRQAEADLIRAQAESLRESTAERKQKRSLEMYAELYKQGIVVERELKDGHLHTVFTLLPQVPQNDASHDDE